MTPAKAKVIFATHMQAARKRKLTGYELEQLGRARQVLRQSRKPAMNPHTRFFATEAKAKTHVKQLVKHHVYASSPTYDSRKDMWVVKTPTSGEIRQAKHNPGEAVLIYGSVDRIYATKTQEHICDAECKRNGHRYFHNFKTHPKMYGLPDGSILLKS
jgi:hypothetical protein